MQKFKCLIVDDDQINREIVKAIAEEIAECQFASDGQSAIALFSEAIESGSPYDFALLDIMLPDLDGFTVLNEFRRIEQEADIAFQETCRLFMLSALDSSKAIMNALAKGAQGFLVKPITLERLTECLQKSGMPVNR